MDYLILALATWRISSLVTYEDGPFGAFEKVRSLVGVEQTEYGQSATTELGKLIACLWCNSVWTGALVTLVWLYLPIWVLFPLAFSTIAIITDETIGRLKR